MPPGPTAPCSLAGLLAEFRPCFTAPFGEGVPDAHCVDAGWCPVSVAGSPSEPATLRTDVAEYRRAVARRHGEAAAVS